MDRINKFLKKLPLRRRRKVDELVEKIKNGELAGLNCKKLHDGADIYRVKRGSVRIIFQKIKKEVFILSIRKRGEDTYKNL